MWKSEEERKDKAPVSSLSFYENLSAFFSRLTKPSVRRRTTSHAYLEFSANIVTAEVY